MGALAFGVALCSRVAGLENTTNSPAEVERPTRATTRKVTSGSPGLCGMTNTA